MFHAFLNQVAHDLSIVYKCYGSLHKYSSKKKEFILVTSPKRIRRYTILSVCLYIQTFLILLNLLVQVKNLQVGELEPKTVELTLSIGFQLLFAYFLFMRSFCSKWEVIKDRIQLLNGFLLIEVRNPNLQSKFKKLNKLK